MNVEAIAEASERIAQAGEKTFKLLSKKTGFPDNLEKLSLPKGVSRFEKVLISGKNSAEKDILIDICSYKNLEGNVLGRVTRHTENGIEIFRKIQNYQYFNENSRFIDTKIYDPNYKLLSSQQEVRKLDTNNLSNKPVVTRAIVTKNNINENASDDIHFWGEFQNISEDEHKLGIRNKELKFSFQRNEEGFISSPLNYEKIPYGVDTYNPFITTYAENTVDAIHDSIQINAKGQGFSEMPKVQPLTRILDPYADGICHTITPRFDANLNTKEPIITDINVNFPTIEIALKDKLEVAKNAGHEVKHLCQCREMIDNKLISKMEGPTKSFWNKERLTTIDPEKAQRYTEGFYEHAKNNYLFKHGFISKQEHFEKYFNNIREVEAREVGFKAEGNYKQNLNAFKRIFPYADWGRLMAYLPL